MTQQSRPFPHVRFEKNGRRETRNLSNLSNSTCSLPSLRPLHVHSNRSDRRCPAYFALSPCHVSIPGVVSSYPWTPNTTGKTLPLANSMGFSYQRSAYVSATLASHKEWQKNTRRFRPLIEANSKNQTYMSPCTIPSCRAKESDSTFPGAGGIVGYALLRSRGEVGSGCDDIPDNANPSAFPLAGGRRRW